MRWQDVADGVWTIRAEAREKGTGELLKLPKMALEVLEALPRIAGNPHVFPARGRGPFNSFSQRKLALDRKLPKETPQWQVHDLRRTARSLMSRADVRPDIAERVLGQRSPASRGSTIATDTSNRRPTLWRGWRR